MSSDLPGWCKRALGGRVEKKNWIKGAVKPENKGLLHKELHIPQGEKIPAKKLNAAKHSDNPKLRQRANFAATMKGLKK